MKKYIYLLTLIPFANASVSDGPYVGLEAGVANEVVNFSAGNINTNGLNLTNSPIAFLLRGNLGYNFDKYNGFELGTTYNFNATLANPGGSSFNVNATTIDLSYILSLPTTVENLSVFGRLGIAYDWINSANVGCCCGNSPATINGNNFADVIGAGIKYKLSPKLSWRIEWIANGLIFPVNMSAASTNASWTNQTFQTGINYSF